MGNPLSCFRRTPANNEESEQLLDPQSTTAIPTAQPIDLKLLSKRLVYIWSALNSGKLPSQNQVNAYIKATLKSDLLLENNVKGDLSSPGRKLLRDLRKLLGLVLVFGQEKNNDDKIQEIIFHTRTLAISAASEELIVFETTEIGSASQIHSTIISDIEKDIPLFISSLHTLFGIFLTSASFRLLFEHLSLILRQQFTSSILHGVQKVEEISEKVQSVADRTAHVADQVHGIAEGAGLSAAGVGEVAQSAEHVVLDASSATDLNAEDKALHQVEVLKARAEDVTQRTLGELRHLKQRQGSTPHSPVDANMMARHQALELDADRAGAEVAQGKQREDAIIESVQKMLLQIHDNPVQLSALRTVFSLSRKWLGYYQAMLSLQPSDLGERFCFPDTPQWEHLRSISGYLKELLERLAGGKSLDPLLHAFEKVVTSKSLSSEAKAHPEASESELVLDLITSFRRIAHKSLGIDGPEPNSEWKQSEYIKSSSFRRDVGVLIEKINTLKEAEESHIYPTTPNGSVEHGPVFAFGSELLALQLEFSSLIKALYADRTSRLLFHSLNALAEDVEQYLPGLFGRIESNSRPFLKGGISTVMTAVLNDIFGFIVPKVIGGALESLFGRSIVDSRTATEPESNDRLAYSEETTSEWSIPLPLPRIELVSSADVFSKSESRWLEGALDPRLMLVRIQDNELEEVRFQEEEGVDAQLSSLTSCFHWCCCSAERDLYADAEAGYVVVPREPAQLDLANLLTPSSISFTQSSETRVDFYSAVSIPVAVDSEPLLVDVTVPGETPHESDNAERSGQSVESQSLLVDFDVSTSVPVQNPVDSEAEEGEEEDQHLLAIVESNSNSSRGRGSMKTAIHTAHRLHLHIDGILSSLPRLPTPMALASPTPIVKSEMTRRLTLENIAYYARYNILSSIFGSWLGVGDEGLLDLEFEFRDTNNLGTATSFVDQDRGAGDGAVLGMDLEFDAGFDAFGTDDADLSEVDLPFKVSNTVFTLPHTLDITPRLRALPHGSFLSSITSMPRKLLLSLLLRPIVLPLAKIVIRRELESMLAQGIENVSETVGRIGVKVVNGARERARKRALKIKAEEDRLFKRGKQGPSRVSAKVSFGDLWDAFVRALEETSEETSAREEERQAVVDTKVKEVGSKGVQVERTAVVGDEVGSTGDAGDSTTATTTTTIAVGVVPQLLPDKADLVSSTLSASNPSKIADEAIEEMQTAAGEVLNGARDGLEHGIENVVQHTQEVTEVVQGVREGLTETREGSGLLESNGWRSTTFDL
ncbi:hypothetical protein D9757_000364 [Collybiopsis confluens]|uniref:HAM1-like N-terminal domain-containing protein n=1 Tax=Collybiopsis confluens TaxID=2823264 RepID=A0A8H5MH45_9AGAR|nr:hypothetical protein D9757_000364 [Collybiopsis confluens]